MFELISEIIQKKTILTNQDFNNLALRLFAHQYKHNTVYQTICKQRGIIEAARIKHWQAIPLITTDLFKSQSLFCASEKDQIVQTFCSSGTTQTKRSRHYLSGRALNLYKKSLWSTFAEAFGLNNLNLQKFNYLVLSPSFQERPESSLIYMFETIRQKFKAPEHCFLIEKEEIQLTRFQNQVKNSPKPVLLLGTAFAFVHLLDILPTDFVLPTGSLIMETGGFKGKSREIPKSTFYKLLSDRFKIPLSSIVGQYGMSELGTQYYDLNFRQNSPQARIKTNQAWTRIRILNPQNLNLEVSPGETGLIAHYDLTNLDSIAFVLSGDLGIRLSVEDSRFIVLGRASSLSAKGCSLTDDLLLKY